MLTWMIKAVRQFFLMVDNVIYNGIIDVYRLLIDISRTSVLSQASIESISNRIYQLLAVFMAFKVIFSLIMYVVNPDDFSDKSKGVSKLGLNVIITLSILVLTPYIFSYAYQLQAIILEDNSLGTLIFGDAENSADSDNNDFSVFTRAGELIAFNTMKPFFLPNSTLPELSNCVVLEKDGAFNKDCSGINFDDTEDENYIGEQNSLAGLAKERSDDVNFTINDVKNYVYGMERGSLSLMLRADMALATVKTQTEDSKDIDFVIDYKCMLSTPIGIIVLLLLITFCMDVAVRSIKLSFLQLIAPIPILSYLDPKSGKDGMFKKWYQLCFKTYASLFVRLLALYLAIFIITKIDRMSDILNGAYQSSLLIKIFVIIGALMFARQLPKILEGLGIKLDGDGKFVLNPLKKFENEAVGGKQILGGAKGFIAGTAVGTMGMLTGAGVGRFFGGAIGGLTSGIKGKKMGEIRKDNVTRNAEMRRAIASGSSFGERLGARFSSFAGTPGRLGRLEHEKLDLQNRMDNLKAEKTTLEAEIKPTKDLIDQKGKVKSAISDVDTFLEDKIKKGKADDISRQYNANVAASSVKMGDELSTDITYYDGYGNAHTISARNADGSAHKLTQNEFMSISTASGKFLKSAKTELMKRYLDPTETRSEILESKESFNARMKKYENEVDAHNALEQDTTKHLIKQRDFSTMGSDVDKIDNAIYEKNEEIRTQVSKIATKDEELTALSNRSSQVEAEVRDARASMQAVHGQEGGPSNPHDVTPARHTTGYRAGGLGSGEAPAASGFNSGRGVPNGGPGPGPGPGAGTGS